MLEQENTKLLVQVEEMQNLVESLVKDQQLSALATKELQDFLKATLCSKKMKDLQEDYIKVQDERELKQIESGKHAHGAAEEELEPRREASQTLRRLLDEI
jgi:hypothetical protein